MLLITVGREISPADAVAVQSFRCQANAASYTGEYKKRDPAIINANVSP
jgi:hypothetical protein